MSIGAILVGLALLILAIPIVAGPIIQKRRERLFLSDERHDPEPEEQYKAKLVAVRDLDFDHELGVVNEEDYAGLRMQMMSEAAQLMAANGAPPEEELYAQIEAAVRARRASRPAPEAEQEPDSDFACAHCGAGMDQGDLHCTVCGSVALVCPSCDRSARAGDRFCPACGAELATEVMA